MQAIYYAGGLPFRDEIIQAFAVDVTEHNEETGEENIIHALGTLKVDGAVTLFRTNGADSPSAIADVLFSPCLNKNYKSDVIDLRNWEIFSVQSIEEFNNHRMEAERGYVETDIDDNY